MNRRIFLGGALVSVAFADQTKPANAAEEVLAFERAMEAAVVRGDVAYVDSVSAPDLSFTHGDGWTTGGNPLLVDDRKTFLKKGRKQTIQYPRPRLRQSRDARRYRDHLRPLCSAEQNRGARSILVLGLV
jgi:hypothetical protein